MQQKSFKKVLLLGASGSIGGQSIDIIKEANGEFVLTAFSVGKNYARAVEILDEFKTVKHCFISDPLNAEKLEKLYPGVVFYSGKAGLSKLTKHADFDLCVDALVGFAGLEPAVITLRKNKVLCLANKEALVTGGTLINRLLAKGKGKLFPIDSEHVALAKCLSCCEPKDVKRLIITASGGALRNIPQKDLKDIKAEQALKHPTWKMGNKITIDCATMMNKGFEIIEAFYLYHYPLDKIDVVMHDESLVHSGVELNDGTFIVDYGKPDMHNPIKWAMYQGNIKNTVVKVNKLSDLKDCHFHEYDPYRYTCTELAKKALRVGASKMIALNAANEILVSKYLKNEIGFLDISEGVSKMMGKVPTIKRPSLTVIKLLDKMVRLEMEDVR